MFDGLTLFAACGGNFFIFEPWYKYIVDGGCKVNLDLPADLPKLWLVALAILEDLLKVGGIVAVIFVIYGGFRYITSQGEPENTRSAQQTIINALIGLFIVILAVSVVRFIGGKLG